jgi:hypothetical protein
METLCVNSVLPCSDSDKESNQMRQRTGSSACQE